MFTNLRAIADKEGIEIKAVKKDNAFLSSIEEDRNGKVTICYNSTLPEKRKRFAIAHELAHYFLGHLKKRKTYEDVEGNFNSNVSDVVEREANELAIDILIPKKTVEYLIDEKEIFSVKKLAEIMKVSEAAMVHKLKKIRRVK